jgi:hypothetical protein
MRGDPRVVPALLPLIDDPDDAISNEAERTLRQGSLTDEQRIRLEEAAGRRRQRREAAPAAPSGSAP